MSLRKEILLIKVSALKERERERERERKFPVIDIAPGQNHPIFCQFKK